MGFQVAMKLMRNASGHGAQTKTAQSRQQTSNSLVANGPHSWQERQTQLRQKQNGSDKEHDDLSVSCPGAHLKLVQ